jgi:TonB-dependent starch-binding outer membrane protein SusC
MNMKGILLLCCCCLTLAWDVDAQQRSVSGKVTDASDGTGLPGVSVLVKGTSNGTATDADGTFTINATNEDVLTFSFIGFESQEITVGAQTTIDVKMAPSMQELSEVVVIGYGEREKKDVTGAISSMDADDISKSTAMTPQLAMQGRMAGVLVSTPSGDPFARPNVQIRGVATFGFAEPLYVIDGIPVLEGAASSPNAGEQDIRSPINIMTSINPNDIESISVLKDASSAAIYGVRASNGVILITTKKGKAGRPKVEFSAQRGVQNVIKKFDMLNTADYTRLYQEAYANNPEEAGNLPSEFDPTSSNYLGNSPTYNWQDQLAHKNAVIEDYSLRVSGGNESTTYYVSGGYGRTEGSLIQSSLDRYSVATNVTSKVSKVIETGVNLKLSYNEALDNTGTDLSYVATAPPWQPIYDATDPTGYAPSAIINYETTPNPDFDPSSVNSGPLYNLDGDPIYTYGPATRGNVFASQQLNKTDYAMLRTLGNAYLQIEPLKGLKFKGSVSGDYYFNLRKMWINYDSYVFSQTPGNRYAGHDGTSKGSYAERQSRNFNLITEFSINYNRSFGDHNVDVLLNAMDQKATWSYTDASSAQVNSTDPALRSVSNRPPYNGTFTGRRPQRLQGYLARVSYKFKDKYYLDATIRRDAASVFAADYRVGTFPSVAGGWRISAEPFFQNLGASFIDDLKFRGGWGELGNKETTQGFAYLSTISTTPDYSYGSGNGDPYGTQTIGAVLPNFPNFELTWERVRTSNVGFDAILFGTRVSFTAEYYNRFTKGIIQQVALPPNAGIRDPADLNVGNVRNSGVELQLGYNNQIGDFALNISGNLTTVKNRVVELYQGTPFGPEASSVDANTLGRIQEGYPIGYLWGFKTGGIFQSAQEIQQWKDNENSDGIGTDDQQPGDFWFQDINGDPAPGQIVNPGPDSVVNNSDRVYLGKTIPGFYYGFNLGTSYKGIDLSLFFQGVGDVQKYNQARAEGEGMSSTGANQWTTTNGRWTVEHPSTTMPRAVRNDPNENNRSSDRFVEDAGFLRLKNVQVGYTFPSTMLPKSGAIERIRVYFSATNLFTITDWKGIDPENDFNPPTRQLMFGLNASF